MNICGPKIIIFFIILTILIAHISFNLIDIFELYKDMNNINNIINLNSNNLNTNNNINNITNNSKNCHIIKGLIGVDDITYFENYLIGSSDDRLKLFEIAEYGPLYTENGGLFLINPDTYTYRKIKLDDFPKDLAFHPQGLYYSKDKLLYVINHAYVEGGERIEVFEINNDYPSSFDDLHLKYKYSFKFTNFFNGRLSDLIITNSQQLENKNRLETDIYITISHPIADPLTGRDTSYFARLKLFFILGMNFEWTHVYYCKVTPNQIAKCQPVYLTGSKILKGITYDENNKLIYISKPLDKSVTVYRINPDYKSVFHQEYNYNLEFIPLNLEFDYKANNVNVAIIGRGFDIIKWIYYAKTGIENMQLDFKSEGGVITIYPTTNSFNIDYYNKDEEKPELNLMSSVVSWKDKFIIGSWLDDGILICSKIK